MRWARWLRAFGLGKLSTRLLLLVVLAAVPVLAIQVYHELEQRRERRAEVAERVQETAELVAAQFDRLVEGAESALVTLGQLPSVRARRGAVCSDVLVRLSRRFPKFAVLAAATPQGGVFCSNEPSLLRVNIADRGYFRRALAQKALIVSDLLPGHSSGGRSSLVIAQPVLDDVGEVETVLVLALYPEGLSKILAQVPLAGDAVVGVLDGAGRIVARLPHVPEIIGQRPKSEVVMQSLLSQARGSVTGEGQDGVLRFYGFARSEEAPSLVAYVGLPRDQVFAAADRRFVQELALLALGFLLAAGLAWWFGSYAIRRPIVEVRGAIDRMAAGDLAARASASRSGIEELAGLARSFDDMARQRMRAEERQQVLLRELNHRIKNAFALVRSVAAQTLRHSPSLGEFEPAFLGRIDALARISTLLAADGGEAVDLRALVETTLAPHRTDGNLRLGGADVALPPPVARTLSLALHELTTNAAKYGALSVREGSVDLRWRVEGAAEARRVVIEWTERGGPAVRPPERRGFGCTLIERSVAYELDGTSRLEFAPEGVRCRLAIPVPEPAAGDAGG